MFSVVSRLVVRAAGAGIERPLVQRDEEHAVVVRGRSPRVPLPWCTSQSTIATRSRPSSRCAARAAIATLLKTQKPIARSRKRVVARRAHEREAAVQRRLDRRAGREQRGLVGRVGRRSCRSRATPATSTARTCATCSAVWHEPQLVLGRRAALASSSWKCSSSTASRSGRSGWCAGRVQARERRMRQDVDRTIWSSSSSDATPGRARPSR